jgi:hypothetical protein
MTPMSRQKYLGHAAAANATPQLIFVPKERFQFCSLLFLTMHWVAIIRLSPKYFSAAILYAAGIRKRFVKLNHYLGAGAC